MQRMEIIIPAMWVSFETIESKLTPLLETWPTSKRIIVHAYSPTTERRYFFGGDETVNVSAEYENSVAEWCAKLRQLIGAFSGPDGLEIVRDRDIEAHWRKFHDPHSETLVVMFVGQRGLMPFYRSIIRKTDSPVLALFERHWHSPVKVVAAVDPFHEHDEDRTRDVRIVKNSRMISRALGGRTTLFHSCHIPAYLSSYKRSIEKHVRDGVEAFVEDSGFGHMPFFVGKGLPVPELRRYVAEQGVDILGMGSVARGFIEKYVLGSTADGILSDPPCDLLLLRS